MDVHSSFLTSFVGNRYLLVIVDCFTKWVKAFLLKNSRAKTVGEVLSTR